MQHNNICDKIAYNKPSEASGQLAAMNPKLKKKIRIYKCKLCGKWHAHTPKKKSLKRNIIGIEPPKMPSYRRTTPTEKSVPLATEKIMSKEMASHLKRLVEGSKYLKE